MAISIPNNLAKAIANHYTKIMDSVDIVRTDDLRLYNAVRLGRQEIAKLQRIIENHYAERNDKHGGPK